MKEPAFPQSKPMREINEERSSVILKLATSADADILSALRQKMGNIQTYSVMDPEEQREEFRNNVIYFIEKDGVVVGSIAYEMKSPGHAYLSDLVINPEYQGQGLARESLVCVLRELESNERIDVITHPENKTAIQLYLSLGFQVESRKENHYGDGEPRLVLAKMKQHENR